jgi:PucR C-terminal helix-turn-helix domain/GGDEF-like domain
MQPNAGSVDDARAVVVARLRARREELVAEVFARVRGDAFDRAGGEDAEYVAGLHAAVVAAVEYVLEGIELEGEKRSPAQRRVERVRRLLAGGTLEAGAELDYELDAWHLGVIAIGAPAAQAVRELAAGVDRRLLSVAQDERSVWAWLGGREPFVAGAIERAVSVAPAVKREDGGRGEKACRDVVLAIGEPARGLQGWRQTHQQAQAALVVALRRSGIRSPTQEGATLTRYADVALLATALKDEALAKALIDIYLVPLEDSRGSGAVLRQTLRAYLAAERSVSSAAAALGVVRKTVESRLRTVEEKLGRTLHPCPAELEVALLLDELSSENSDVSP